MTDTELLDWVGYSVHVESKNGVYSVWGKNVGVAQNLRDAIKLSILAGKNDVPVITAKDVVWSQKRNCYMRAE